MKKQVKLSNQKKVDSFFGDLLNRLIISIKFFGKREIGKNPKKILFFKTEAVGDSLLCLPMIREVKKKTKARIYVICSKLNSFVFERQNFIDDIILINPKRFETGNIYNLIRKLRKERIDVVIDTGQSSNISAILSYLIGKSSIGFKKLKGISRNKVYDYSIDLDTNKHMTEIYFNLAKPLGIKTPKRIRLENIKITKKEKDRINKLIKNKKKIVGIHACNVFDYRAWPKERFAKIIEFLIKERKNTIILMGSPEEKEENEKLIELIDSKIRKNIIDLSGKLSFSELVALMKKLEMFIGNDGGPMHIAASENIPVIGLFGYETPLRYGPFNKKSIAIYKNKECSPCHKPYCNQWTNCLHHNCIKEISVEEVKNAIKKI